MSLLKKEKEIREETEKTGLTDDEEESDDEEEDEDDELPEID